MIYKGSRYTRTSLYDRGGTLLFNQRNRISFGKKNCVIHTYSEADRLDNLRTLTKTFPLKKSL